MLIFAARAIFLLSLAHSPYGAECHILTKGVINPELISGENYVVLHSHGLGESVEKLHYLGPGVGRGKYYFRRQSTDGRPSVVIDLVKEDLQYWKKEASPPPKLAWQATVGEETLLPFALHQMARTFYAPYRTLARGERVEIVGLFASKSLGEHMAHEVREFDTYTQETLDWQIPKLTRIVLNTRGFPPNIFGPTDYGGLSLGNLWRIGKPAENLIEMQPAGLNLAAATDETILLRLRAQTLLQHNYSTGAYVMAHAPTREALKDFLVARMKGDSLIGNGLATGFRELRDIEEGTFSRSRPWPFRALGHGELNPSETLVSESLFFSNALWRLHHDPEGIDVSLGNLIENLNRYRASYEFLYPEGSSRDYFLAVLKKTISHGVIPLEHLAEDPQRIREISDTLVLSRENFRRSDFSHTSANTYNQVGLASIEGLLALSLLHALFL